MFILVNAGLTFGQPQKTIVKVKIVVKHNFHGFEDRLTEYISKAVIANALKDVEMRVVSDGEDFMINVVAVDEIMGDRIKGYAISFGFFKTAKCTYSDGLPQTEGGEQCQALMDSSIITIPISGLENSAREIAKGFKSSLVFNFYLLDIKRLAKVSSK